MDQHRTTRSCPRPVRKGRRAAARLAFAAVLIAAVGLGLAPAEASAQGVPALSLPIDCVPGKTCWIAKFVDLDPGPGALDYMCAHRANDRHSGVDFAVRDLVAMKHGVAVMAAARGVVTATSDGAPDISVKDAANEGEALLGECGNGVTISHGGGWATYYCHMRDGSIAVHKGDKVEAGQTLGFVGMSGSAEFPHLHFTVRNGDTTVDPFLGVDGRPAGANCGPGKHPLWTDGAMAALAYTPVAIDNVGFADEVPTGKRILDGVYRNDAPGATAPVLAFWVDMYGLEQGDVLSMRLFAPGDIKMAEIHKTAKAKEAHWFQFIGNRRHVQRWPAGTYRGEVTVTGERDGKMLQSAETRMIEVR